VHPTILQIGPIAIRAYPFMLALAFLAGTLLAIRLGKRHGILTHEATRFATIVLIASVVGSRVLYILEHYGAFSGHPIRATVLWQGGLSYHGGLFLSLLAGCWWLKRRRIPIGAMLDVFAPGIALGFFLVRIGCFLNGCCFGIPTDVPWAVVFPPDSPAGWVYGNTAIHPTQLYGAFSGLVGFLILLGIGRRAPFADGRGLVFLSLLVFSSLWRFIIEFFRYQEPHAVLAGGLTEAQSYCLGIFVIAMGTALWVYRRRVPAERDRL
jgi:phosphatidylglycerol:prolipoprotein diacylglycerol transferase